jgi:hypothetical protein
MSEGTSKSCECACVCLRVCTCKSASFVCAFGMFSSNALCTRTQACVNACMHVCLFFLRLNFATKLCLILFQACLNACPTCKAMLLFMYHLVSKRVCLNA